MITNVLEIKIGFRIKGLASNRLYNDAVVTRNPTILRKKS
jgi:hypothetical protein